jgi:hypothetical protein
VFAHVRVPFCAWQSSYSISIPFRYEGDQAEAIKQKSTHLLADSFDLNLTTCIKGRLNEARANGLAAYATGFMLYKLEHRAALP